jgi:hypothetical protein
VSLNRSIYSGVDPFPFAGPRVKGRVLHHMDLATLQQLDGDLFDIKYLLLVRNATVRKKGLELILTQRCHVHPPNASPAPSRNCSSDRLLFVLLLGLPFCSHRRLL